MRSRKREAEITGNKDGFILGDLRWLVSQTEGLSDHEQIRLYYNAGTSGVYTALSIYSEED